MRKKILLVILLLLLSMRVFANEVSQGATKILTKKVYKTYEVPPEWKICSIDSDCTSGVIGCYRWEPINKKYIMELYNTKTHKTHCKKSVPPGFQPVVGCVEMKCQYTGEYTKITEYDWEIEMQKNNKR